MQTWRSPLAPRGATVDEDFDDESTIFLTAPKARPSNPNHTQTLKPLTQYANPVGGPSPAVATVDEDFDAESTFILIAPRREHVCAWLSSSLVLIA